jgi:hypothetical protein
VRELSVDAPRTRTYPRAWSPSPVLDPDDARPVRPNGGEVRRRRHALGLSPRDLVGVIADASWRASGIPRTITPSLLEGIEERNEPVAWDVLRLVAAGLDCDPTELLREA